MSSSSKKITYTSEFKLKVLDYYFKHGGDDNFGLKTKTAGHFNIDKKTINRMLNNPEMVKRARRLLAKRHSSTKTSTSSSSKSPSTSSTSSSAFKSSKSGKSLRKVVSGGGRVTGGSGKAASSSASTMSAASGASGGSVMAGLSGGGPASASTPGSAASSSRVRCVGGASAEGVKVLELPEDPDYSLLKRSINASANGVANMAKLLVTGTEEVRKLMLNECDVILECKVCQNLFRSIVNFLAHKRIYCQESFADVRTLFHRDNTQGVTSQSGTVVVEPEEPPASPTPAHDIDTRSFIPPPHTSAREGGRTRRRIDSIADRLAGRQGRGTGGQSSPAEFATSHPTHTGSAKYYERLQLVNSARDKLSQDCSVVLEDIRGVPNARLQTFQPYSSFLASSSTSSPLPPMSQQLQEVSQRTSGVSVALGERGEIVKTARGDVDAMDVDKPATSRQGSGQGQDLLCRLCNTRFATSKTLSVHQRSFHGLERRVYSCPICKTSFITMWGVVKHLERVHKKTKHQTDRLKRVIRKNMTKKLFFPTSDLGLEGEEGQAEGGGEGGGRSSLRREKLHSGETERRIAEGGETAIVGSTNRTTPSGSSAVSRTSRGSVSPASTTSRKSASSRSSQKRDESGPVPAPEHRCGKCERRFMTPQALISHEKFCSLQQMKPPQSVLLPKSPLNPRLRSETPEKRIAIQIRKDYKKPLSPASDGAVDPKDSAGQDGTTAAQDVMTSSATGTKLEALMKKLCHMSSLTCVPCGRRYQTITTLKRHISVHFNWTRYACRRCSFRSYNRYELTRHATTDHGVSELAAADLLVEDVAFGPVKYSLSEAEAEDNDEGSAVSAAAVPPVPLQASSARVEVNGIGSEGEEGDVEGHKHTNTHAKLKDSTGSESASEIITQAGTVDPECREVPETEKNQQNGSGIGEGRGQTTPSHFSSLRQTDEGTEMMGDGVNKPKEDRSVYKSTDSNANTPAEWETDGMVAVDRNVADGVDSRAPDEQDDEPKKNQYENEPSAGGTRCETAGRRRTEAQASSEDSMDGKRKKSPQESSDESTKGQSDGKRRTENQEAYGERTRRRHTPQDSSEDGTNTPDSSRRRESPLVSSVLNSDLSHSNRESGQPSSNSKSARERDGSSESTNTQSDGETKLLPSKRSRKKPPMKRRLYNHPPQGSDAMHNTCNGTHGDEKTNGSHTAETSTPSASPQLRDSGRTRSATPQPPGDTTNGGGWKSVENCEMPNSGGKDESGTGKERKMESEGGGGGVQNSRTEGKEAVS